MKLFAITSTGAATIQYRTIRIIQSTMMSDMKSGVAVSIATHTISETHITNVIGICTMLVTSQV